MVQRRASAPQPCSKEKEFVERLRRKTWGVLKRRRKQPVMCWSSRALKPHKKRRDATTQGIANGAVNRIIGGDLTAKSISKGVGASRSAGAEEWLEEGRRTRLRVVHGHGGECAKIL